MLKFKKRGNSSVFKRLLYETAYELAEPFSQDIAYSQENLNGCLVPEIPLKSDKCGIYHLAIQ